MNNRFILRNRVDAIADMCVADFSYFQKDISLRERFLVLVIKDKFVRLTCKMFGHPASNFRNTKGSIFSLLLHRAFRSVRILSSVRLTQYDMLP